MLCDERSQPHLSTWKWFLKKCSPIHLNLVYYYTVIITSDSWYPNLVKQCYYLASKAWIQFKNRTINLHNVTKIYDRKHSQMRSTLWKMQMCTIKWLVLRRSNVIHSDRHKPNICSKFLCCTFGYKSVKPVHHVHGLNTDSMLEQIVENNAKMIPSFLPFVLFLRTLFIGHKNMAEQINKICEQIHWQLVTG